MVLGQLLLRCLNSGIPSVVGMKAHIGVDEVTGLVHSVMTTAANVGDVT
jgi:IS5 family transposase